ncbi:MAG: alkylmercury lyase family protein [Gammaproteobacteria bacterium]|nr:alkylmercury lyase family protein [Gammaproteobacteria bacterium]
MHEKIKKAVDRLNNILPLKANQQSMSPEMQQLHRDILYSYIELGRSLTRDELAQRIDNVDEAINLLQQKDMVVFDSNREPVGAYPFTMEKREHKISVNGHLVHSMCALDSLAISPMYGVELEINSICHVSGEPILIRQNGFEIINSSDVENVFFAINWNAASANTCCADSLCAEMIFLKDQPVAHNWLNEDVEHRQIFTLNEAVEFAAEFFTPLLKR